VAKDFPDMRSIIKKIQQFVTRGIKELNESVIKTTFNGSELFELILNESDPWKNYQCVIGEWGNKADEGVIEICKDFPEYFREHNGNLSKLPLIVIACAEAQEQLYKVVDKTIVLLALIYKIQLILKNN
jgi:hypothetical protein